LWKKYSYDEIYQTGRDADGNDDENHLQKCDQFHNVLVMPCFIMDHVLLEILRMDSIELDFWSLTENTAEEK
jgi:hypothetical protein